MISRETFSCLIKAVQDQEGVHKELAKAIGQIFDGNLICTANPAIEGIMNVLETEMGDTDIISWWLWDSPEGGKNKSSAWIEVGDNRVPLETSGQLYDYLKSCEF